MHVQCQVHVVLKQLVRLELAWMQPTADGYSRNCHDRNYHTLFEEFDFLH